MSLTVLSHKMKPETAVKQEGANSRPNLAKMCRLCLAQERGTIDIFDTSQELSLPMRVMACTALEVQLNDALPKLICQECRIQLERSYYFRKRSQLADSKLRKHIRLINAGKESRVFEPKDEEDDDGDEDELADSLNYLTEVEKAEEAKRLQEKIDLEESLREKCRQEETDRIFEEAKSFFISRVTKKNYKLAKVEVEPVSATFNENYSRDKSNDIFENAADSTEIIYNSQAETFDETYYLFKGENEVVQQDDVQDGDDSEVVNDVGIELDEYTVVTIDTNKGDNMELETIDFNNTDSNDVDQVQQDSDGYNENSSDNSNSQIVYTEILESEHEKDIEVEIDEAPDEIIAGDNENENENDNEVVQMEIQQPESKLDHIIETNMPANNEELKIFKCLECPQAFTRRAQLLRHNSVHDRVRGYQCKHCKKWFACKSSLDRHTRIHTGDKPFECTVCHRRFIQKEILKRHMSTHTGDKPYTCPICNKAFVQKQMMNSHINLKHTENPLIQMHECFLCPKSFCHASGLSRHLLIHSGVTYTCKICDKKFSDKSAVKRHTVTVHC